MLKRNNEYSHPTAEERESKREKRDDVDDDNNVQAPEPNGSQAQLRRDNPYSVRVETCKGESKTTLTFEGELADEGKPVEVVRGVILTPDMTGDADICIALNRLPEDNRPTGTAYFKALFMDWHEEEMIDQAKKTTKLFGYTIHHTKGLGINNIRGIGPGEISFELSDATGKVGTMGFMFGGGALLFILGNAKEPEIAVIVPPYGKQVSWRKNQEILTLRGKY